MRENVPDMKRARAADRGHVGGILPKVVLLVAVALAAGEAVHSGWLALSRQLTDFRAFYCGGTAVNLGTNPYRVEPLRACEHRLPAAPFYADSASVAPAPLPGFAFLPFALLARLPFGVAATVWTVFSVVACGATVTLLAATLRVERTLVAATLVMSALLSSVVQGQLIAGELAAIAGAGLALSRGHPRIAGGLAALTLLETHLGLPIVLCVAVLVPRARLVLLAGVAIALAASFATLGVAPNFEYVTVTLPQQVAAELRYQEQYSLSYALQYAGVDGRIASALGSISYIVACTAALAVSRRLLSAGWTPAIAVFVPAAFAVIGGPYIHVTQTAAAIPLALTLWSVARVPVARARVAGGLSLIAVAWPYPYESKPLLLASVVAIATIWWYVRRDSRMTMIAAGVTALALWLLENRPRITNVTSRLVPLRAADSASQAWEAQAAHFETHDPVYFSLKVLTWTGMIVIAAIASLAAFAKEPVPAATASPRERSLFVAEDLA